MPHTKQNLAKLGLVGLYFHAFNDAEQTKFKWQGIVRGDLGGGYYIVQCFDWLEGAAAEVLVVPIAEMTKWQFYETHHQMRRYHKEQPHRGSSSPDLGQMSGLLRFPIKRDI